MSDMAVVNPATVSCVPGGRAFAPQGGSGRAPGPTEQGSLFGGRGGWNTQSTISTDKRLHKPACVSCHLSTDGRQNSSRPYSEV